MNCKSLFKASKCLLVLVLTLCTVGCGQQSYPVRPDVAMSTLKTTLDLWKSGQPITECQTLEPKVVAQDMDWMAGQVLKKYEVLEQRELDSNLFVTVQLYFESEENQREVTYCVGTDPVLTVFRAME